MAMLEVSALDSPYKWSLDSVDEDFLIGSFRTEDGRRIELELALAEEDGVVAGELVFLERRGGRRVIDLTGLGDARRILATVVDFAKDAMARGLVAGLHFSADRPGWDWPKDGSRVRLYRRVAKRFARRAGLSVRSIDEGPKVIFIIGGRGDMDAIERML